MADYLIKDTTLTGIADAIRAKTGSADAIMVSDMASRIAGISGGGSGGSVAGVHYVTFMSEDGTTELYKRAVADGDDCADPVDRGLINAPTKESTVQHDYSFVGWATTPNGAWDENALKAVTADKTVYAVFAATARYYTITYYDDDGTTVLATESLAYGSTPSYMPTKAGYAFVAWTPAVTTVIGDKSYTATWATAIASGTVAHGNATWVLGLDGVLTISGEGAISGDTLSRGPWGNYYQQIKAVVIEDGITSIDTYLFYMNSAIERVELPNNITYVGDSVFRACTSLKAITLPNDLTAMGRQVFCLCSSLERIIIPGGVTSFGKDTFYGCTSLESATFENTENWYVGESQGVTTTLVDVTDPATNVTHLVTTHLSKWWTKV